MNDIDNGTAEDAELDEGPDLSAICGDVLARWRFLLTASALAGALAWGGTWLFAPTYTAQAALIPPQQQGGASSMLASLGALGSLVGGAGLAGSVKSSADQYIAFMQSNRVIDPIIDRFKLMDVYDAKFRVDARKDLLENSKILAGKKDGLITIAVDDHDPQRAADIANAYIEGLRLVTNTLAVTEAQQRRVFFEQQLTQVKGALVQAQAALQASGFSGAVIKAEPKAAAEGFAKLKAETTTNEVKLQALRRVLSDNAPEVVQQSGVVAALRAALAKVEQRDSGQVDIGYISKYREYKYQEVLFEMFSKQYELARVDESREGALIQVLDAATVPERKSKPYRGLIAAGGALLALLVLSARIVVQGLKAKQS